MAEDGKQEDATHARTTILDTTSRDVWLIIALKLDRASLHKLICAWRWFATAVTNGDNIWKQLLHRHLGFTNPIEGDLMIDLDDEISWRNTYTSVFKEPPSYPLFTNHLIAGARLGGLIMPPSVWVAELDLDFGEKFTADTLKKHGFYIPDLLPGLWVVDAHHGLCPACTDANCGWTKTTLSLWHSKLHLLDGSEDFCPNTVMIKHTLSCSGIVVDGLANDMELAAMMNSPAGLMICGLNLAYNMSEKGITFEFVAGSEFDGKEYETEFRLTRDQENRVVAIHVESIVRHFPRI